MKQTAEFNVIRNIGPQEHTHPWAIQLRVEDGPRISVCTPFICSNSRYAENLRDKLEADVQAGIWDLMEAGRLAEVCA